VITQRILLDMGLDLQAIKAKQTNLNAQEIGNDRKRAEQWRRYGLNPVFDERTVADMVTAGLKRLAAMQLSDGGWGWFSGYGEKSYSHTTAYVVHGLQVARSAGVNLPSGMLERGVRWLQNYQAKEIERLKRWEQKKKSGKARADNLDAFVYMVLVEAGADRREMGDYLYRDRTHLAVYARAMFGMALYALEDAERLKMILQNIEQYLVQDDENQTAYLVLVRQRIRSPRVLSKTPGPHGAHRSKSIPAGKISAQQPQTRHLLEEHPGYGGDRRGFRRIPHRQR
jgi:uncharacterized protein YfaS (alpha-2-macroglobulin family)